MRKYYSVNEICISKYSTYMIQMKIAPTEVGYLFFGPLPSERELKECGTFDLIWNLGSDVKHFAETERKYANQVLCAEINDYSIPTDTNRFSKQLEQVLICLRNGGKIYVHCCAGHGRTGMALACILGRFKKCSPEKALALTHELCGGPEMQEQKEFVEKFLSRNIGLNIPIKDFHFTFPLHSSV